MHRAICLMGPTACGKTELAISLVKKFPLEIISVDSAMIYTGMNIGSAKPSAEELAIAPHRLIDVRDPSESYSAADFRADALRDMQAIVERGNIPLLVGGTMLYFKALQEGLSPLPSADEGVRKKLEAQASKLGWQAMHERLEQVDPVAARRIHPNDPQRLQRALEVFEITGKSLTELQSHKVNEKLYEFTSIGLIPENRAWLHERIARRFQEMLEQGFLDEVKKLYARADLNKDLPALRCVGYRQAWQFLQGDIDELELCDKGVVATRQLAKRQMTWLRSWPDLHVFDPRDVETTAGVSEFVRSIITAK